MDTSESQPNMLLAFLGFKRMVSPVFIGLFYFLGLFAILAVVASAMIQGPHMALAERGMDFESGALVAFTYGAILIGGLLMILVWRFCCELLIVLFGIFRLLGEIKALLREPLQAAVSAARVQATIAPIPLQEAAGEPEQWVEPEIEPQPTSEPELVVDAPIEGRDIADVDLSAVDNLDAVEAELVEPSSVTSEISELPSETKGDIEQIESTELPINLAPKDEKPAS